MQNINHWPDMAELTLPEAVSQDLYHRLLEPFDSEKSAKEFWAETYSTVIILDHSYSIKDIKDIKQTDAWNGIEFTLR